MKPQPPRFAEIAVLLYCGWIAGGIFSSWYSTPHMRMSLLSFCIWLLPVLFYQLRCLAGERKQPSNLPFLLLALLATTAGLLGQLNALKHVGLALALAAFLPLDLWMLLWFVTGAVWTPAFGYFFKMLSPPVLLLLQIAISTAGTLFYLKMHNSFTQDP